MNLWHVVKKEILYRKLNFGMALVSVVLAAGCLVGSLTLLKVHDERTRIILARKEAETKKKMDELKDEVRRAMLKLGFNLVILPEGQNLGDWYAEDYASRYMPEEYVTRLANSGIITVRHFLPTLQQKIKWPETKRTIILVGTRGEVPNIHKSPRKPLVQPVPAGGIVLGHELHQSLGLKVADEVQLSGRSFTVHKCHEERGTKDDITAWINLREAQEMLEKKGLINAILALECICQGVDDLLSRVRADIAGILPGTRVIEIGSRALARAEARAEVGREAKASLEREEKNRARLKTEREAFTAILVPLIMLACGVWIAFLGFTNVRDRRVEIGILRAMGFRSGQIMFLFLSRSLMIGLIGGGLGFLAGALSGSRLGFTLEGKTEAVTVTGKVLDPALLLLALAAALILTLISGWIPALLASQQDPAEVLRTE